MTSNIFENIGISALKERATRIENYCSRQLDYVHSTVCFRYFNNHGSSHSKKVLERLQELLDDISIEKGLNKLNEYECFVLYVSAWCHDLGLMPTEEDEALRKYLPLPKFCELIREFHCTRVFNYLTKNWEDMGIRDETEASLLGNICRAHCSNEDIKIISEELPIVVHGEIKTIRARFLAALLRLADALDARWDRLPPRQIIKEEIEKIPAKSIIEYWKHEVVESIRIDHKEKKIFGKMIIKREYPPDIDIVQEVKRKLKEELASVKDILEEYGISLEFEFLPLEYQIKEKVSREELKAYSEAYLYKELEEEEIKKLRKAFSPACFEFNYLINKNFLHNFDNSGNPDYLRLLSEDFKKLFFHYFNKHYLCIVGKKGVGKTFSSLLLGTKLQKEGYKVFYSSIRNRELSEKIFESKSIDQKFLFIIDDCQEDPKKVEQIYKKLYELKVTVHPRVIFLLRARHSDTKDIFGEDMPILTFREKFVDLLFLTELWFQKINKVGELDKFLSLLRKSDLSKAFFKYKNMAFWNMFFKAMENEIVKGGQIEVSRGTFYNLFKQYLEKEEPYVIENKDILVRLLPFFKNGLPVLENYACRILQIPPSQIQTLREKKVIDLPIEDWDINWDNAKASFIRTTLHPTEAEILWELFEVYKKEIEEKATLIEYADANYENLYYITTPVYFNNPELFKELCYSDEFIVVVKRYLRDRHLGKQLERVLKSFSKLGLTLKENLVDEETLNELAKKCNSGKFWFISKVNLLLAMYKFSPLRAYELYKRLEIENLINDFNNLPEEKKGAQTFRKFIEVSKNMYSLYLFSIDYEFKTELDSGIVSEKLRRAFADNNHQLISDEPRVEKVLDLPFQETEKWKIIDEKTAYLIRAKKEKRLIVHLFTDDYIEREIYVLDSTKKILDRCYERFIKVFEGYESHFTVLHWLLKNLNQMKLSPKTRVSLGNYFLEKTSPKKIIEWIKRKDTEINELRFVLGIGKHTYFEANGIKTSYYDIFKASFSYNDIKKLFDNKRANLYSITITSMFNPEILAKYLYQYSQEENFAKKITSELCDKPTNLYVIDESIEHIEKNFGLSDEQKQFIICKIIIIAENYGFWKFLEPLSTEYREREKKRFLTFKRKYHLLY